MNRRRKAASANLTGSSQSQIGRILRSSPPPGVGLAPWSECARRPAYHNAWARRGGGRRAGPEPES
eukprot:7711757-Lingulodinium_polyedra.AAC.1